MTRTGPRKTPEKSTGLSWRYSCGGTPSALMATFKKLFNALWHVVILNFICSVHFSALSLFVFHIVFSENDPCPSMSVKQCKIRESEHGYTIFQKIPKTVSVPAPAWPRLSFSSFSWEAPSSQVPCSTWPYSPPSAPSFIWCHCTKSTPINCLLCLAPPSFPPLVLFFTSLITTYISVTFPPALLMPSFKKLLSDLALRASSSHSFSSLVPASRASLTVLFTFSWGTK